MKKETNLPNDQKSGKKKKNRNNQQRNNDQQSKATKSGYKGETEGMNGHIFENNNNPTQFHKTCEQLIRYSSSTYKYGNDLKGMIKNLKDKTWVEPEEPKEEEVDGEMILSKTKVKLWERRLDNLAKRQDQYDVNKESLASVIWGQCTENLQAKVRSNKEFDLKYEEESDSLWLLKTIRGIVYKFETQGSIYKSLYQAHWNFMSYRQRGWDTPAQYLERFQNLLHVVEQYKGSIGADPGLVHRELERNNIKVGVIHVLGNKVYEKYKEAAYNRYIAQAFLMQSDMKRYKTLVTDLANSFTTGTDKYPKNLTAAYNLLINYEIDSTKQTSQNHQPPSTVSDGTTASTTSSFTQSTLQSDQGSGMAFVQKNGDTTTTTTLTDQQAKAVNMLLKQAGDDDKLDQAHDGLNFGLSMHIMEQPIATKMGLTKTQKLILKNGGTVDPH